jgi:alkylhydroperoxidase/carboxymuconolactone decarboxylase family protein YurZ
MPYYIEPAEQTPEVQAQLDALIKVRMDEDGGTINPESLTVLDPACGSGHILVEAYNLLRAIYEERGYRLRDIPRLILQKNLYGLDIDDRAAQLAGFALLMKAREDDRRLFDEEGSPPHLNVMAIQQSAGLPDEEIARVILNAAIQIEGGDAFRSGQLFGGGQLETQHSSGLTVVDLRQLIQLFEHGKTLGALISVPDALKAKLGLIVELLATVRSYGDDLSRSYAIQVLEQFSWPASILSLKYDAVVANPPYMGSKSMNKDLKEFARSRFPDSKSDLFSIFIEQGFYWCKPSGLNSMVTMQSWMFLSSYEALRERLLESKTTSAMVHMSNGVMGIAFGTVATVFWNKYIKAYEGQFSYCHNDNIGSDGVPNEFPVANSRKKIAKPDDFKKIPGSPFAYWVSSNTRKAFESNRSLRDVCAPRQGMATGNNDKFLRYWYEVDYTRVGFSEACCEEFWSSGYKYARYNKGGSYRKWYGNNEYVIKFSKADYLLLKNQGNHCPSESYYFRESITWSDITTKAFGARLSPVGAVFDVKGSCAFPASEDFPMVISLLASGVVNYFMGILNPTVTFQVGDLAKLPVPGRIDGVEEIANKLIAYSKSDWNGFETSYEFDRNYLVGVGRVGSSLCLSWKNLEETSYSRFNSVQSLEIENNRLFIEAYGLQDEISPIVNDDQITLTLADREKDAQRLVSYSVGCMMGRYSLDEPGLIYARSGNTGFDTSRYCKFPADADGIIPVTDESWFEDDAAERVREFVKLVWGADALVENMEWLADSLGRKSGESADEAIRRYLSTSFYKDHLQTYKKRPIYWLFSSGKQKAFECLVYLHRYNEGTLSRMRMEYVVPLQSRMQARIDKLIDDIDSATSSAQQKALQKRKDKLTKQLEELRRFDEYLRPYADQRITLDLDDGVKVNYGKFGELLSEVKAITGGKEE